MTTSEMSGNSKYSVALAATIVAGVAPVISLLQTLRQ